MGSDSFVHLHVHTEYSMLDGAARVGELLDKTKTLGMPAIAMTDHGNVFGAYDFYTKAKKVGLRPIIGMEGYLAPGSRFERKRAAVGQSAGVGGEDNPGEMYTHMTLLAESNEGMSNLFRLASLASLEGYYYKPRVDRELLERYGRGIIATTGCPSGEVNRLLQRGEYRAALQTASEYRDIFGEGNFYCELMDHGIDIESQTRADLIRLARELRLPMIATNDLHYTNPEDCAAHEVLLCVQTGKTLSDPKRFKFNADDFYLKSPAEMRALWAEFPEACDNTLLIAERCDVHFVEHDKTLEPQFPVPDGETEASWLEKEVMRGLTDRFDGGPIPEAHLAQARYELDVINEMRYPGYFLVVADLCRHARSVGIGVGPGRGSAAGCLVAWALGITQLDPIRHKLVFERFLNPERISMPDIDLDFDDRRRGDMIRYATEKYGEANVAQIVTYGTIKAKQAIKDSSRVLGFPYAVGDKITKAMPPAVMGKEMSLAQIFDPTSERYSEATEFRQVYDTDTEARTVIDTARGLEGLRRQWGVHAAGVILCAKPLLDVLPIMRREADGAIITQFDMGVCETLGLLKMDFLGLRNLTILIDAHENIQRNRGIDLDIEHLPLDDAATYDLLARGDTLGVFQLDGGPMRSLLRSMQPDNFEDISAVIALYRPGPMGANAHIDYADRKNGRSPVTPIHPELAEPLHEILADTYGLIVYQEQVMSIAQKIAGYTLGGADLLRRAMGKKKKEILEENFADFEKGAKANGYSDNAIKTLWDILVPFSGYAFNRAHSAGYGIVSYWTAYLKANYPAEYMAALLTSVKDDKDKTGLYLHECRRMGIKVLAPDVNESVSNFAARGGDIRFGLSAIRNVGENVVASIVATRESKGAFTDFIDFLAKVDAVVCNKRTVESLIKAGAFDSFGHTRRGLLEAHIEAIDAVIGQKRKEAEGQFSLFGDDPATDGAGSGTLGGVSVRLGTAEWDKALLLAYEREMLGLYVSDHPLAGVEWILAKESTCSIPEVFTDSYKEGDRIKLGGIIGQVQRKVTKAGNPWALVQLEDLEGSIEISFFPATYAQYGELLAQDSVVIVSGKIERRDDQVRLIASQVSAPDLTKKRTARVPVTISVPAPHCTEETVGQIRRILADHPGRTDVHLRLTFGGRATKLRVDDELRVERTPALLGALSELLGPGAVT